MGFLGFGVVVVVVVVVVVLVLVVVEVLLEVEDVVVDLGGAVAVVDVTVAFVEEAMTFVSEFTFVSAASLSVLIAETVVFLLSLFWATSSTTGAGLIVVVDVVVGVVLDVEVVVELKFPADNGLSKLTD